MISLLSETENPGDILETCNAKELTDRYEVIKKISTTNHSAIYLIRHAILDELRIAKIVKKNCDNYERMVHEAHLMKDFRHRGIPLIYDIEEYDNSICIIEEYIAGKSLTEYINKNGSIMPKKAVIYAIQICSIMEYLHNFNNVGVLHLDIKPDNIIIDNGDNIKVIDFDNSTYIGENGSMQGTAGFAAPEQYYRCNIDARADIYSIGILIMYMTGREHIHSDKHSLKKLKSDKLYPVIKKCIAHNPFQRFNSVSALKKELMRIEGGIESNDNHVTKKSYSIYVYGAKRGIGTTHLALSISSYIAKNNYKVVCIKKGGDNDLMSEALKGTLMKDGTYQLKGVFLLPDYGDNIECSLDKYDFKVYDCGLLKESYSGDCNIFVTDIGYRRDYEEKMISTQSQDVVIAVNHISGEHFYDYIKNTNVMHRLIRIPCIYDWYDNSGLFGQAAWEILSENFPGMFGKRSTWIESVFNKARAWTKPVKS